MLRYKNMAEVGCLRDGCFQNLQVEGTAILKGVNRSARTPDRYYLDEYFLQRPGINANIDQASTVEIQRALNRNFETVGTNMTTALTTFSSTHGGVNIATAGADEDQAIIAPHLDTNATAWSGVLWGTENQVEWECAITIPAIANIKVWAGLKLTNDGVVATDADQAYFKFQTTAGEGELFTDFTILHFVHSISSGVVGDYISALPITVVANNTYHLKITIDSDRKASIFVDGVQYNVTTTIASTAGTAVTAGGIPSTPLTDNINLIPYIGVEGEAASAANLVVSYQCINRIIHEKA
jgi:hypothetical protein